MVLPGILYAEQASFSSVVPHTIQGTPEIFTMAGNIATVIIQILAYSYE